MKIKKTLEAIVTPVRLGWHGVTVVGLGISLSYLLDTPFFVGALNGVGAVFYIDALHSYLRTRKSIKEHNKLDKRVVEKQLLWYCNRQGSRTAAINYGYKEEYDKIMKSYKGEIWLTFIPHI